MRFDRLSDPCSRVAGPTSLGRWTPVPGSLSLSKRGQIYSPMRSQSSETFSQALVPDFRMIGQPAVFCVPNA